MSKGGGGKEKRERGRERERDPKLTDQMDGSMLEPTNFDAWNEHIAQPTDG